MIHLFLHFCLIQPVHDCVIPSLDVHWNQYFFSSFRWTQSCGGYGREELRGMGWTYLAWPFYRYGKILDLLPYLLISGLSAISPFTLERWWYIKRDRWGDGTYFEVCERCIDNLNISIFVPSIWTPRKSGGRGHTVILSFLLPTISIYPLTFVQRWGKMWEGRTYLQYY